MPKTCQRLIEITLGAMRHFMEKPKLRGFIPVGFSIVMYNPNNPPAERWNCQPHTIIDAANPDLYGAKLRARIDLVNKYIGEGIKQILEGEHDDLLGDIDEIKGQYFHIPGAKGKA